LRGEGNSALAGGAIVPWCPTCGYEYVPGTQLCPECREPLVNTEAEAPGRENISPKDRGARDLILVSLISIPASILLSWLTLNMAMSVGHWVGASHEPLPLAAYVAYVPSIACTLVGLGVMAKAHNLRAYVAFAFGILVAMVGAMQFCLVGFMLAMASIS